jgi:hypothetical protein
MSLLQRAPRRCLFGGSDVTRRPGGCWPGEPLLYKAPPLVPCQVFEVLGSAPHCWWLGRDGKCTCITAAAFSEATNQHHNTGANTGAGCGPNAVPRPGARRRLLLPVPLYRPRREGGGAMGRRGKLGGGTSKRANTLPHGTTQGRNAGAANARCGTTVAPPFVAPRITPLAMISSPQPSPIPGEQEE